MANQTITSSLDLLRHAAMHRLCVELRYNGSTRVIEPYSLRLTQEGDLLLCARRRDSDVLRTYRADRIEGVSLTETHFVPLYNIEMTVGGPFFVEPSLVSFGREQVL